MLFVSFEKSFQQLFPLKIDCLFHYTVEIEKRKNNIQHFFIVLLSNWRKSPQTHKGPKIFLQIRRKKKVWILIFVSFVSLLILILLFNKMRELNILMIFIKLCIKWLTEWVSMEISYKILENQRKITGIANFIFVRAAAEIVFFQMEYFHFIQYKALATYIYGDWYMRRTYRKTETER